MFLTKSRIEVFPAGLLPLIVIVYNPLSGYTKTGIIQDAGIVAPPAGDSKQRQAEAPKPRVPGLQPSFPLPLKSRSVEQRKLWVHVLKEEPNQLVRKIRGGKALHNGTTQALEPSLRTFVRKFPLPDKCKCACLDETDRNAEGR